MSAGSPGEAIWSSCAVVACVLALALYLWSGVAANAVGFLLGAIAAPVAFAASRSCSDLSAGWGAVRTSAVGAAAAGWAMGAAHCFFWAQALAR